MSLALWSEGGGFFERRGKGRRETRYRGEKKGEEKEPAR